VQCFSAGEWHGLPYLEIEYIPGASMDEVLRKCTLLSAEQTLAVGVLICRALSYAHTQVVSVYGRPYKGVIHRDLKPANIMLSRSGKIKLTDFGIARPQSVSLHTADATKIVGTFPYLAPEQLDGKDITIKTDLYALGATLYELVTGDRVFPQSDITTLITAKSKGQFKSLRDSSLVPGPMAGIIEKALALNPADRYESAAAMGKDLERTLHSIARDGKAPFLPNLVSRFFG
jgi:serine/threonine-protein kinase